MTPEQQKAIEALDKLKLILSQEDFDIRDGELLLGEPDRGEWQVLTIRFSVKGFVPPVWEFYQVTKRYLGE